MMTAVRYLLATFFFLTSLSYAGAQIILQPKIVENDQKGVVYASEKVYEIRAHLHGLAVGYKTGKLRNFYETTYMSYELGYMVDSRQKKFSKNQARIGTTPRRSFYYGKRSSLITARVSYGMKRYLSEKTKRKGVAMGIIYEGGATIGLIKPTYINVVRRDPDIEKLVVEEIKYSDDTHDDFLDFDNIYGGTRYYRGLTEITPTVGLHGKVGMHWAIGAFDQKVKAVEAGLMLDIYPRKIPFVAEREDITNDFAFLKLYVSAQFGKRSL